MLWALALEFHPSMNQSVEKAGVKGASERNDFFFLKICTANEQGKGLTISGTNLFRDELRQVTKGWCIIAPIERYSGYRYFQ